MSFVTKVMRRGLTTSALRMAAIKHVTVIGGGQMGAGIAQVSFFLGFFLNLLHQLSTVTLTECGLHYLPTVVRLRAGWRHTR